MLLATVSGNLGRDAELKDVGRDRLCAFSVASTSKVKGQKVTTWVGCSIWGRRGESLAQYLTKGTRVVVTGELSTREHNGKTYLDIRVDQVDLMGGGSRGSGRNSQPADDDGSGPRTGFGSETSEDPGGDDEIPF